MAIIVKLSLQTITQIGYDQVSVSPTREQSMLFPLDNTIKMGMDEG